MDLIIIPGLYPSRNTVERSILSIYFLSFRSNHLSSKRKERSGLIGHTVFFFSAI